MIIRLKPIPVKKLWGGNKLSDKYGFSLFGVGEVWGISALKSNSNIIINGNFKGLTFRQFYIKHREYFGNYPIDEFPILFKLIDAKHDLSIQVHPNNKYATMHENSYGKDECWYIIDSAKESKIQIGHKAKNKATLKSAISNNNLINFLNYYSIKPGDYYYIPSGKVHAICKNTTLLEVSQSSDITYRLFDYNRLENGKMRTLHIEKSLDVITFPDSKIEKKHNDKYFSFNILDINDEIFNADLFGDYIYVVDGKGSINKEKISKGDFLVVTSNSKYEIFGKMKVALVRIKKNK